MIWISANFFCRVCRVFVSSSSLALDADNLHGGGMISTEMAGAGRDIGTGRHLVLMLLCK